MVVDNGNKDERNDEDDDEMRWDEENGSLVFISP